MITVVLVVVDMGFAGGGGGLVGGCGDGTVGGSAVVKGVKIDGMVVGTMEATVVTKGVTGGNGLVTGILDWGPEGGSGVVCLGGKGRDAGLTVY